MLNQKVSQLEIDSVLLTLSIHCPIYCPNAKRTKDCALCKVRKFSMSQKNEWLEHLTGNQKLTIFQKHEECFAKNRGVDNRYS